jgi:hypothetical protein
MPMGAGIDCIGNSVVGSSVGSCYSSDPSAASATLSITSLAVSDTARNFAGLLHHPI